MLVNKNIDISILTNNEQKETEKLLYLIKLIKNFSEKNKYGSTSISINGDWGTGKTTYLKAIESYYKDY